MPRLRGRRPSVKQADPAPVTNELPTTPPEQPLIDLIALDAKLLYRRAIFKPNACPVDIVKRLERDTDGNAVHVPIYMVRLANNTTMAVFYHELSVM